MRAGTAVIRITMLRRPKLDDGSMTMRAAAMLRHIAKAFH